MTIFFIKNLYQINIKFKDLHVYFEELQQIFDNGV